MDINDVLGFINTCNDEALLRRINRYTVDQLRLTRNLQARAVRRQLNVGDTVAFTARLSCGRGRPKIETGLVGTVTKIKQKFALVTITGTERKGLVYNVPLDMLTVQS